MVIKKPQQKYTPIDVESRILRFWSENDIFKKSVEQRRKCKPYVFLEGPPTANGLPHPGHVLTRVMKDLILRYKTMNGYYVQRRAGWDTHGLPVEIEVEKRLGLHNKQEIEEYGIKRFNDECKKSVFTYEQAWVDMTRRIGFWIDMDNPYVTLKNEYIESVWWSLKQAYEKKLLYKGYKVVPYCPRCGTALSAHELSQGYKTVDDPSIFVKFKLKDKDEFLLAWTTTPWTLISNVALAVHPEQYYIKIRYNNQILILAEERALTLLKNEDYEILDRYQGKDLEYKEYEPLFNYAKPDKKAYYIVTADFVTMEEGTGIVHIAPAFGEDDYKVGVRYDLPMLKLVKPDGTFLPEVTPWNGLFVKNADQGIIDYLRDKGYLLGVRTYTHQYPFCWRCNSPLLYYAMDSWFIAMSKMKDQLVKNNNRIKWYPSHLQQGRFGDFIYEVKDWALSRERYWGTPLPIWICTNKKCKHTICVGSINELKNISEDFPSDYDLHKPFVDELEVKCPLCKSTMTREKEVIDCWYDSGASFFAQWHYPFENQEEFKKNYPVDFICEALDQTRGWFYSLLAISTILFGKNPYKTVLTLGLVLDKNNQKMSKSKQNYVDPNIILDNEGADAMRWYLISSNAPWMSTQFYEEAVKDILGRFILTLYNSYNFFATYAALDEFSPADMIPYSKRNILDKWIISRFNRLVLDVRGFMNDFEVHKAARALEEFIIDDFSNWYLRRSRKRVWTEEKTKDKLSGYSSMYEVFLGLCMMLAPFIPFITEEIYQCIKTDDMPESVHLCDYPRSNKRYINDELELSMRITRELVEYGRSLRSKIGVNVRYPIGKAYIVCSEKVESSVEKLLDLLQDELNIKKIEFKRDKEDLTIKIVKPNYNQIGSKYKSYTKMIKDKLDATDTKILSEMILNGEGFNITLPDGNTITLKNEDFHIVEQEHDQYAKIETPHGVIFMDKTLTKELISEGFARELIRRIQSMRKDLNLDVEDEINVEMNLNEERQRMIESWCDYIKREIRAESLVYTDKVNGDMVKEWDVDEVKVKIGVKKKE